ncbi:pyruvate kinase [Miltoncostaea marina]|uniref:pyruvate kinase n=1 Tax=Miltoncostaea marina TaxID=2843215 RepID=UPI001C3DAB81|nr:pyruvate kinase [Miltoncostaea marina]
MRRTKILATLGPACDPPGVVPAMVHAGVDGFRINLSHGEPDEWTARARAVRAAQAAAGRPLALLCDLQGPKIRLAADTPAGERIDEGEVVRFVAGTRTPPDALAVVWDDLVAAATPGVSELVIGDGTPRFSVEGIAREAGAAEQLVARCTRPGAVGPRKGATLTHAASGARAITDKDRADIAVLPELAPDFVALSFVRHHEDVRELRELLREAGLPGARIVAKIEKAEAVDDLAAIIDAADAVMVARGDLGIELGLAEVPLVQKRIVAMAREEGKLCITATQMLESMTAAPEPTRAEVADVANAVLDGTSAVMLSGETAQGAFPVETVRQMAQICLSAERAARAGRVGAANLTETESVMKAAASLADELGAAALCVPTETGGAARAVARQRPLAPIVALCHRAEVACQMALEWGVLPVHFPAKPDIDPMLREAIATCARLLDLRPGDPLVVTYGPVSARPGATSLIALRHVEGDGGD